MKVYLGDTELVCVRERGDRAFKNESALWHAIKKALIALGHNVIKKLMWKDGHMTDSDRHYVRTRKPPMEGKKIPGRFMVHDQMYALRQMHSELNKAGKLVLAVER